jgi:hypothetical protein
MNPAGKGRKIIIVPLLSNFHARYSTLPCVGQCRLKGDVNLANKKLIIN